VSPIYVSTTVSYTAQLYRCAEFFLRLDTGDPCLLSTWRNSVKCFSKAAKLFSPEFEAVEIPYNGSTTTLPGYFCKVDDSNIPRPTLIYHGGFDSIVEE
jgi:hypothetical protein